MRFIQTRLFVLVMLACASSSWGQSSVPPPTRTSVDGQSILPPVTATAYSSSVPPPAEPFRDNGEAAKGMSTGLKIFRSALDSSAKIGEAMSEPLGEASKRTLNGLSTGLKVLKYGADLSAAERQRGMTGVGEATAQIGLNEGFDAAGKAVANYVGVVLMEGTTGVVGASYWGGAAVGGLIRDNVRIGGSTIGDIVTNGYWGIAERAMHLIDPSTDPAQIMSDENIERKRQEIRARRAREFTAMSSQNQQAAQDRAQALESSPFQPQSSGAGAMSSPALGVPFLPVSSTANAAPIIDPHRAAPRATCNKVYTTKDGCHPGHNEKSHPGGCRC